MNSNNNNISFTESLINFETNDESFREIGPEFLNSTFPFVKKIYEDKTNIDSIKEYNDELRNFHEFTLNTSSDQSKFVVIERFDAKMKEILKNRETVVVYFDDFTK
jgi:hypothetical protein